MRKKIALSMVMAVALAVGAGGGVSPEWSAPEFGGALPLWELEGSPVMLLPGEVMNPVPADRPWAMVVADLTGDGRAELVVGGDYLHVLSLHDGKIAKSYLTVLVGVRKFVGLGGVRLGVRVLAAGDMDRDGRTDLVVGTHDGELWVLRNHAQWGFQWGLGSPYPVSGDHVWLFDHDENGSFDVILGWGSELVLLRNDGKGRLGKPEAITGLEGRLWAGTEGRYTGRRGLFLLTDRGLWFLGQGQHAAERVLDRGGLGLAVANFTGLGKDDVAIGWWKEVRVYPGEEDGLGEPVVLELDHIVAWLLAGDLNGDGVPDLVAGASSPAGFSVFYNWPGRGFMGPYWHGVDVPAMRGLPTTVGLGAVGDLTGDGRDDLAVAAGLGHIAFFHTKPRGRSLQAIPGSFLLGSVDVNEDGYPDLLTSTAQGGVAALVNSGWGTFTVQKLVGPSGDPGTTRMPYRAQLGDVTGDGKAELVVFEFARDFRSEARITVWKLEGKLLWSWPLGMGVRPLLVLSDQTGDGVLDVVAGLGERVVVLSHREKELPERREFPWGGLVGPLVGLRDGSVAGLRLGLKTSLVLLRKGEVVEMGVELELAPFDLIACDLSGNGREDLIAIGWAAWEEKLVMALAVLWAEGDGYRPELFPLKDWLALALPYPYGGLTAADLDGDGKLELAAMRLPDQQGNPGGVAVIPWSESGPGELAFLPGCVGTGLLALDLDGDGCAELLAVHTGIPARLCITRWR